jgi:hypothetical protein
VEQCFSEGGFAAAGLAHHAEGLALADIERDAVHGMDIAHVPVEYAAVDGEVFLQVFDTQKQFFAVVHFRSISP